MADDDSSTSGQLLGFPELQGRLEAALRDSDPQKLPDMVRAAEGAIVLRQQALVKRPDGQAERQDIEDALHALRVIQREKLEFPTGTKRNILDGQAYQKARRVDTIHRRKS